MEEWKDISGYENYQISSYGNIWSKNRNRMLKTINDKYGYKVINLYNSGKLKSLKVHRLVGKAFIQNPDEKPCIDHINGIIFDNIVSNLRWCTYSENRRNINGKVSIYDWTLNKNISNFYVYWAHKISGKQMKRGFKTREEAETFASTVDVRKYGDVDF